MSMTGRYCRVTPTELGRLIREPDSIVDFLYPDDDGAPASAGRALDIDRSWHALHFLLTGEPWDGTGPLFDTVLGGTEVGDDVFGYGPVRCLTPEQVAATAAALRAVSADDLARRFDPAAFNVAEIYPGGWVGRTEELDFTLSAFERLAAFFDDAARAGDGMLLYLA